MTLIRVFSADPHEDTLARRLLISRAKAYEVAREVGVVQIGGCVRVDSAAVDRFVHSRLTYGSRRQRREASALRVLRGFSSPAILTRKRG